MNMRDRQIEAAMLTIERAQRRIDFLAGLPDEPTTTDPDGALVVWFQRKFRGRAYTYAAVKVGDGFWYVTGKGSLGRFSWEDLVMWANSEQVEPVKMWVATEFSEV